MLSRRRFRNSCPDCDGITLTSGVELRSVVSAWSSLHPFLGLPTAGFDWSVSCAERLCAPGMLRTVALTRGGDLVAIAPFMRPRVRSSMLVALGGELGEPWDVSCRDPAGVDSLAEHLAGSGLSLHVKRVFADSPFVAAVRRAYEGVGLVVVNPTKPCPYIPCAQGEERTVGALSKQIRSDLRRAARRAAAMGSVSFEVHAPASADELAPLWATAIQVEAGSWKGEDGTALASDPRIGGFFATYAIRAMQAGVLRLAFMRIDGVPAAMQVAIEQEQRVWLLKIGYRAQYAKCSPGNLLIEWTLRRAARQLLKSYEFLGSRADWTDRWTRLGRATVSVKSFPYSPRGLLQLGGAGIGFARRRFRRAIR